MALSEYWQKEIRLCISAEGVAGVSVGDRAIPVDRRGFMRINFYNGRQPVKMIPASDVLAGTIGQDALRDKLVFVGVTEVGIADVRPTPVDSSFPGVAIHATVASNIIQGFFLHRDNGVILLDIMLICLVPLVMLWVMSRLRRTVFITLFFLLAVAATWFIFYGLVSSRGLLVSLAYPVISATIAYLSFQAFHILVVQRHSRYLRQAFSSYISPQLVDRIVSNPDMLALKGKKQEITVLFSDIRGFTLLSEKMPLEELVQLLNGFLGSMTDIIMDKGGTLDKYIGDAIMAIFNAPVELPDHRARAVESACLMLRELRDLNRDFRDRFGTGISIGIGIHTGQAIVGNLGSTRRFDYTAVGDTVNLASRLEGATKMYGAAIVISADTARDMGPGFYARKLDRIRVKGRKGAVEIWQVLEGMEKDEAMFLSREFHRGLDLYYSREFSEAAAAFQGILKRFPEDGPSSLYLDRCREYSANPPPVGWDGIFTAATK